MNYVWRGCPYFGDKPDELLFVLRNRYIHKAYAWIMNVNV